jgi:two-component system cell cycle response regulator
VSQPRAAGARGAGSLRRGLALAWALAAGAGLTFFALHTGLGLGGPRLDNFASVWVYDSLELLAVAAVVARVVLVREERAPWSLLALAMASWALGDISWTVVYNGDPPFPSLADVFYLGFYPPTYLALALLLRSRLSRFNRSVWLDGVMVGLAVGAVGAAILLEVILRTTHGRWISVATNLAYPLGDIALVAFVVGVFAITRWHPGRSWTTIGAALALTATADSIYLYQSAEGTYVSGTILDALWPTSLLLLAGSAWIAPGRQRRVQLEGRPLAATPAICAAIALAVMVDSYLEGRNPVGVGLAAATFVTVIARMLLTFRENTLITRRIHTLALTDSLTGLANRRKLLADLDEAFASGSMASGVLILYDLDGFKSYNDTFGHPAGDALLRRLGGQLSRALVPYGSCYRLGGDEFCAFATVAPDALEALITLSTGALSAQGDGFDVSTSFGCVFLPDEASDASEAFRIADQRLYAQKYQAQIARGRPHLVLLQALYEREPGLRAHVGGVAALSLRVAAGLGLTEAALEEVKLAAELHDIGKLAIPDATLVKSGPLDEDEWGLIHGHTVVGQRILNASPALNRVGTIVRATHERWDGAGYPDGLRGEEIPLAARIVAVCDAYSAMTNDRAYRRALPPEAALERLRSAAGSQFDPEIVRVFAQVNVADPVAPRIP